jgi:hypothetical protein
MIEKIVQTAKHTVKAMVDSHKARDCAPGSGAVDDWDMPFSVILSGSEGFWRQARAIGLIPIKSWLPVAAHFDVCPTGISCTLTPVGSRLDSNQDAT